MNSLNRISEKVSKDDLNVIASDMVQFATKIVPEALDKDKTTDQIELLEKLANSSHLKEQFNIKNLEKYLNLPEIVPLTYKDKTCGKYSMINVEKLCKKYLSNKSVREKLKKEKNTKRRNDGVYASDMDGWFSDRIRGWLKMEIFIDDAQLGPSNGFGSGSGQKYIMVYVTFPDLPFHFRTQIEDIELLMMIKRSDLNKIPKEDRFATLFSKLNIDLERLGTEGIEINGEKFYVTVSTVLGDNLGIYEFLNFGMNFQTTCFRCRYCGLLGKNYERIEESENNDMIQNEENEQEEEGETQKPPPKKKRKLKEIIKEKTCQDIKSINAIPKLLKEADLEQLESVSKFVRSGYPFASVSSLSNHCTNISSADSMHDCSEGILVTILESMLVELRNLIDREREKLPYKERRKIPTGMEQISQIFRNYSFYERAGGSPKIKWTNAQKVSVEGKGILVCLN